MTFPTFRAFAVLCLIGGPALMPRAAMASTVTTTFTNNAGKTLTLTRSASFDRSTRTATQSASVTGPAGRTATVSVTSTPDGQGGLTVSRSLTGFNGQTHSSSHTYGR